MKKEMNGIAFDIDLNGQNAEFETEELESEPAINLYRICFTLHKKAVPKKITLQFHFPRNDIFSVFKPNAKLISGVLPDWNPVKSSASAVSGASVLALISKGDANRLTVALSDCKTPCCIKAGFNEAQKDMTVCVEIFTSAVSPLCEYETVLRLDMRNIPASRSISDVTVWWKRTGYSTAYLPQAAAMPMYAPWYAYQQKFTDDILLEECKYAKSLGMEAIIVDDGWQTEDSSGGYAFCGDWKICRNKIHDMKKFVADLHRIGMKIILWFSVPFMGKYAESVERFRGKYLYFNSHLDSYVFDPRFREVREYLVGTYADFLKTYDLDGFKLDFIDAFRLTEESPENYADMDHVSLEDAVDALLSEICNRLKEIKPDILLEFRQHYTGVMMQKYGNMFRVGDCPGDATTLRVGVAELRMLTGGIAVHSDPLIWSYQDPVEYAAYQLNHSIFAVPQISLKLGEISEQHRKMLSYYLQYYKENREILLFGELYANGFEQNYTSLTAKGADKEITVLYGNPVFDYCVTNRGYVDLINGTAGTTVLIRSEAEAEICVKITDCRGETVENNKVVLRSGITEFRIPISGFMSITKV